MPELCAWQCDPFSDVSIAQAAVLPGTPQHPPSGPAKPRAAFHLCGSACSGHFIDMDHRCVVFCDRLLSLSAMPSRSTRFHAESFLMWVQTQPAPLSVGVGCLPLGPRFWCTYVCGALEGLSKSLKASEGCRQMGPCPEMVPAAEAWTGGCPKRYIIHSPAPQSFHRSRGWGRGLPLQQGGPGRGFPDHLPVPLSFSKCCT